MDKWRCSYLIEHKTLWVKEKLLVTSNFSFSHNVFKSYLLLMCQNEYLWSKGSSENYFVICKGFYFREVQCFFLNGREVKSCYFNLKDWSLRKTGEITNGGMCLTADGVETHGYVMVHFCTGDNSQV